MAIIEYSILRSVVILHFVLQQGSDLQYDVEVPGPPTVLELLNRDGGMCYKYLHSF